MKIYEHKTKQYNRANNLEERVKTLNKVIEDIDSKTETIIITDKEGYVKRVEYVSKLEDIRTSPIEVELPQGYQAGYFKFNKKTNKLEIDLAKKKKIELSIIIGG